MTDIEEIARMMGLEYSAERQSTFVYDNDLAENIYTRFNPYTNKSDNGDVMDTLGISIMWDVDREQKLEAYVTVGNNYIYSVQKYSDHPTLADAQMAAVCKVAVSLFDRREE